jgi:D-glycero-D-manno-heptose 1,7-bisphosphate phosphatase
MNKALFLDRDGVVNEDLGHVHKIEDFHFTDGIFEICRAALDKGYLLIIVTNQAGIAKGYYSEAEYEQLTRWMLERFSENGAAIAEVFYCPYHPECEAAEYRRDSFDRKPNPGMFFKARDKFGLDLGASIVVGDKSSDMEAGRRAGVGKLIFLRGKYDAPASDEVIVCETLRETALYL